MGYGSGRSQALSRETLARQAPAKQRRYTFGTHTQTCHVWAQQQPETHTGQSSDGRIRFEGETIYSYGSHFPMARFIGEHQDRRVVLFNDEKHSVSTTAHQSDARYALNSLDIVIPVDTSFLQSPQDRKEIERIHIALLERVAADYGTARLELDAFRAIFKPRGKVPADIVEWSRKRAAEAARKAFAQKLSEAKRHAKRYFGNPQLSPENRAPIEGQTTYSIANKISQFNREVTALYSSRIVLATAKAPRKYVLACSATIKTLVEARKVWGAALTIAQQAEAREQRLETLRTWGSHRYWHSPADLGELWALAIAEGMPVAETIGREIQLRQWELEVPETFKKPDYSGHRVTPEQWEAGKGSGYLGQFETLVRRKGDTLQTSRGAECPFPHAVLAYRGAVQCRSNGTSWQTNGHKLRVGHFQVDRIDADGTLHAGCHTIGFDAMTRLAVKEVPHEVRACFPVPVCI